MLSLRRPLEFLLFFFHSAFAGVVSLGDDTFWYLMAFIAWRDGYIGDVIQEAASSLNEDDGSANPHRRHMSRTTNLMEDDRPFRIIAVGAFIVVIPLIIINSISSSNWMRRRQAQWSLLKGMLWCIWCFREDLWNRFSIGISDSNYTTCTSWFLSEIRSNSR